MNIKFVEIIKYNPRRLYFGHWTPAQLSAIYKENKSKEEKRTTSLFTGIISEDDICDALWNEMSYNPERFGDKSPFVYQGKNSIQKFCDYYHFYDPKDEKIIAFKRISDELKGFLELMQNQEPTFASLGRTLTNTTDVGLQEYEDYSNTGYKILSKLRNCITIICDQNGKDYAASKKHHIRINEVILQRHPDLVRPNKIPNYTRIASLNEQQRAIASDIAAKEEEIERTQMRINILQEYEAPADTTRENSTLERQQQQLAELEQKYQDNVNVLNTLLSVNQIQK